MFVARGGPREASAQGRVLPRTLNCAVRIGNRADETTSSTVDTRTPRQPEMDERSHAQWRLAVAPMMDWTDRHCRYFHRLLAPHARLYTEMVTRRR